MPRRLSAGRCRRANLEKMEFPMKCVPWVVAAVCLGPATLRAQDPVPPAVPAPSAPPATTAPAAPLAAPTFQPYWGPAEPYDAWAHRMWITNEYLLWWVKNGPLPVPLITSSNAADVGTLGQPSTQVLYGGRSIDYGAISGYRLSFGSWLNWDRTFGLDSRWIFLENKAVTAVARSNVAG